MKIINVTNVRKDIYNLINEINEYNEPVLISAKKGNVIMLSQEEWEGIQETLYLLSNKKMKEKLFDGKNTPNDECVGVEELGWNIL